MAVVIYSVASQTRWKLASAGGEWSGDAVSPGLTTCPAITPTGNVRSARRKLEMISAGASFRHQTSLNRRRSQHSRVSCSASEKNRNSQVPDGEDMEAFLGGLSLEYDSVWDTKPAWCQPWTILLTGTTVVGASWQLLHIPILTLLAGLGIGAWWFVFLVAYPKSYTQMIEERRERMRQGKLDTYGSNISK